MDERGRFVCGGDGDGGGRTVSAATVDSEALLVRRDRGLRGVVLLIKKAIRLCPSSSFKKVIRLCPSSSFENVASVPWHCCALPSMVITTLRRRSSVPSSAKSASPDPTQPTPLPSPRRNDALVPFHCCAFPSMVISTLRRDLREKAGLCRSLGSRWRYDSAGELSAAGGEGGCFVMVEAAAEVTGRVGGEVDKPGRVRTRRCVVGNNSG